MSTTDSVVDLYWIPLGAGAGGALVRWSGRAYERISACVGRRSARPLFHSALEVAVGDLRTTIEMAPVWVTRGDRGVVAEGAVGARLLGRSRLFRYEVRRWRGGSIPDAAMAVGGAVRVAAHPDVANAILDLVPAFPTTTWGRDELHAGEMWNSNSLTSWLLTKAGLDAAEMRPPSAGRAPGWDAGCVVASRST